MAHMMIILLIAPVTYPDPQPSLHMQMFRRACSVFIRIPPINAHLSRWITNLATFGGLLYRKHCDTDVKGLLSWSVRALAEGGEPAMAAGKVSWYRFTCD